MTEDVAPRESPADAIARLTAANERLTKELAERRRAEDVLRANELSFQLTVDNIPGMVHTMTATGAVESSINRSDAAHFSRA